MTYYEEIKSIQADDRFKAHLRQVMTEQKYEKQSKTMSIRPLVYVAATLILALAVFGITRIMHTEEQPNVIDTPENNTEQNQPESFEPETIDNSTDPKEVLVITNDKTTAGFGHEAISDPDLKNNASTCPWNPTMDVQTMPVYSNPSTNQYGFVFNIDEETMYTRLYRLADFMGIEVSEVNRGYFGFEYEDQLDGISVMDPNGMIQVLSNGTQSISYMNQQALTDPLMDSRPDEELLVALQSAYQEYSALIGYQEPVFTIDYQYGYSDDEVHLKKIYTVYEGAGNVIQNYSGKYTTFYVDGETGDLYGIAMYDYFEGLEKVDDYPLITVEEAEQMLWEGKYIANTPPLEQGEIARIELAYRSSSANYWIPYYRFYVELPSQSNNISVGGLKQYGIYYVPAISTEYVQLEWDGNTGWNG